MSLESNIVNPFDKYKGNGIGNYEVKKKVKTEPGIEAALICFQDLFKFPAYNLNFKESLKKVPVLWPEQLKWMSENLTEVCQDLFELDRDEFKYRASHLLQCLIMKSFSKGHNDFTLKPSIRLSMFNGFQPKRELFLDYYGNLFGDSFSNTKNINATVHGEIGTLSSDNMKHCTLIVNGKIGDFSASQSRNSIVYFKELKHNLGKIGENSRNCAFITPSEEDYAEFNNTKTNIIILLKNKKEAERKGKGRFMNESLENIVDLKRIN